MGGDDLSAGNFGAKQPFLASHDAVKVTRNGLTTVKKKNWMEKGARKVNGASPINRDRNCELIWHAHVSIFPGPVSVLCQIFWVLPRPDIQQHSSGPISLSSTGMRSRGAALAIV